MTSVCGHVNTCDFPSKFNNWDRVDPSELFNCPIEIKEATPKLKMPAFLAAEAKGKEKEKRENSIRDPIDVLFQALIISFFGSTATKKARTFVSRS